MNNSDVNLKLTRAQLEKIATSYASPKPVSLVEDPLPVPEEPVLRYADLIDQDLTRRLIGFTDQLVKLHVSKKLIRCNIEGRRRQFCIRAGGSG